MTSEPTDAVPVWKPVLLGALAGGLGWGIRGQYGHETGAMIAGLLVGLVLALLLCPSGPSLCVARAVAWGTIAMGFGGSMTYGQTIGLTHDAPLVGNHAALLWGMLGLAIKGGLWIGFGGAFLGMGLGGLNYRPREMLLLMLALLALCAAGIWALNEPFNPTSKILPRFYFSDDWRWEPNADLKPRREVWGGFLFALAGLVAWLRWIRRDPLGPRLALWGVLGGALGFPLGQCLQAFHSWNPEVFRTGLWVTLDPVLNWWNFMETTFGAIMGATLGLGLWLNRGRIAFGAAREISTLSLPVEFALVAVHVALLLAVEFFDVPTINVVYDFGLVLGLIPVVAIAGGRWWPWLLVLPITMLPIAGKTIRRLVYEEHSVIPLVGWMAYGIVPLLLTTAAAVVLAWNCDQRSPANQWLRPVLLLCTWLYFSLNFAFFQFPWPWATWTSRTPNAIVYFGCVIGLTVAALWRRKGT
ncbi:MAG TPA: hypothetical protein PLX89_03985 [Verrucomicrobiota bacterium]|nr:hypothetical protein [Verrucomicrobiales bacterium]HRI12144.1 hypothetical protein [Verrucomicrobiota bacterium]